MTALLVLLKAQNMFIFKVYIVLARIEFCPDAKSCNKFNFFFDDSIVGRKDFASFIGLCTDTENQIFIIRQPCVLSNLLFGP